jgi:predicted phage terminase large subunit-like protein
MLQDLATLEPDAIRSELANYDVPDLAAIAARLAWLEKSRPAQREPLGNYNIWLMQAGRGFGKTRPGAEETWWYAYSNPETRTHVIAPTHGDLRGVCIEGESGLLACIPHEILLDYNSSLSEIRIKSRNGKASLIKGFSATEPDRLRGPQAHRIWGDEIAAWQYGVETFDMAMLGLRLGQHPRAMFTTTPKPVELVRNLTKRADVVITRGTTYDNRANLAPSFFDQIKSLEGTRLGRQELDGELIDPEESGIIRRSWIKMWPASKALPKFEHVLLSLDTAFTERTLDNKTNDPDYTGCSCWGVWNNPETKRLEVILLDAWQDRLGLPDLVSKVKEEMQFRYGEVDKPMIAPLIGSQLPELGGRRVDTIVIEDIGAGKSLRQYLAQAGVPAYAYNPGKADKLARLHLASPFFKQGQVWMPESDKRPGQLRSWCEDLVSQLCAFPNVKHDDLMDTATQALRVLSDMNLLRSTKPVERFVDELPETKRRLRYAGGPVYG